MKKFFSVLIAAILAVGFSAFTPAKTVDTYLYQDDLGDWQQVPSNIDVPTVCPAGAATQCQIFINGSTRPIFKADHSVYYRT